jgi:uncharacterized membrane-anchored protein YjiN (DUF445 family)
VKERLDEGGREPPVSAVRAPGEKQVDGETPIQQPHNIRYIATALLALMVATYLGASLYEAAHPALAYVRAFAEAAMIGALADWFAVTALFRHPLGIPIPRTAVIPRNKARIGQTLGRFVERNFLSPELLSARVAGVDFAGTFVDWLSEPRRQRTLSVRLTHFLPQILDTIADDDVNLFVRNNIIARLRSVEIAPLLGELLSTLTAGNRHQKLIDELLKVVAQVLRNNEDFVRAKVRERTAWLWQKLSIDEKVSDEIMDTAEDVLSEIAADPNHAWRVRFDESVHEFIHELKTSPVYRERAEAFKEQLLQQPVLRDYRSSLWEEIKENIRRDAAQRDSLLLQRIQQTIGKMAEAIRNDAAMREKVNSWLRGAVVRVAGRNRHEVARLISDTVRDWDTATVTKKLEEQVGDDLQYIRINGTLIGGLVGLLIHSLSVVAF